MARDPKNYSRAVITRIRLFLRDQAKPDPPSPSPSIPSEPQECRGESSLYEKCVVAASVNPGAPATIPSSARDVNYASVVSAPFPFNPWLPTFDGWTPSDKFTSEGFLPFPPISESGETRGRPREVLPTPAPWERQESHVVPRIHG